ncbi:uncharacterized protein N7469_009755 [Penicillium citrinum]|uniref:Zn(2)-C6 fungal-type domain-containing protein n=1 Tax=Penicillium citrinum TaxID=5077 RepID=A0A9W9NLI1_PENCI|nr:uncharacterized protein N7469_009755 [Penicillium citrinum]KAJ5220868.1 hypothetical protein N7469_009755 [Penicillium citrinum]
MGDKFHPLQSNPDPEYPGHTSGIQENESAPFIYDNLIPEYTQPPPFRHLTNTKPIPSTDDRLIPNPERSLNPKVPIPRSAYPRNFIVSRRVSKACENCREQKAKCTGNRPTCQRCQDAGIRCFYGDGKGEKMLKELKTLTGQVEIYEGLLQDLYPLLDSSSAQHVDQTLGGRSVIAREILASRVRRTTNLIATDYTVEDFNCNGESQSMGFVGEHSDIAWLYRLKRDLDQEETPIKDPLDRPSISSVNYFQDATKITGPGDADVDKLVRPPQQIANQLVEDYFQAVHPEFPIIGKDIFLGQYRSLYSNPTLQPGKRWMAVLNLIFAIATTRSHLAQYQGQRGDHTNHVVYFTRAWQLSMGDVILLDHPNIQQVQVEGLAAFYLLTTGQINRSWRTIGIAIRSAVAIGLNRRVESDNIVHLSKEIRYRVWWALFMLDTLLCVVTGRPPTITENFRTTPLPLPYREEDLVEEGIAQLITDQNARNALLASLLSSYPPIPGPSNATTETPLSASFGSSNRTETAAQPIVDTPVPNISLSFLYTVDLAFLLREVIKTLYAPGATLRSWQEIETAILTFNTHTDDWLSRLPNEFHFGELDTARPFIRQRTSLGFQFYTTKLLISQPCLRRLARPLPDTPPSSVCVTMASICVQVACQMLDMLPDEMDMNWLYGVSPWWCILHYMMQSTTVLLEELFARALPGSTEAAGLADRVQKAIRWLRAMSTNDPSSQRAWLIYMDIFARHGPKLSSKIDVDN